MRYAFVIGIVLSTVLAGGCAPGSLREKQWSVYADPNNVSFNRALVSEFAERSYQAGFRGTDNISDIDEEEFFEGMLQEFVAEADRQLKVDWYECNEHSKSAYQANAPVNTAPENPYANLGFAIGAAFNDQPHKAAVASFETCMRQKGWEAISQEEANKATRFVFHELFRRKQEQSQLAAKSPKAANVAERVFENTWRSVVVVKGGERQGSGVVIKPNLVATNCHVVDSGGIVVYKTGNRRALIDSSFDATIQRRDIARDFCLLQVNGFWGIPANIRAYDSLKVGEDVYALGAPQGLDLSLSSGVVSQLRKDGDKRFIQTDAAISPGSSGGGLFDSDGNLIGITTEKIVGENVEGIGFAIPADLAFDL